jgi:hypothetical protein
MQFNTQEFERVCREREFENIDKMLEMPDVDFEALLSALEESFDDEVLCCCYIPDTDTWNSVNHGCRDEIIKRRENIVSKLASIFLEACRKGDFNIIEKIGKPWLIDYETVMEGIKIVATQGSITEAEACDEIGVHSSILNDMY